MSLYIPNWIYAFSVLYSVINPCVRMTCDFMCLLNPTGASCTCPEGKTLVNGSCIDPIVSGLKPHFTVGLLTFFHGFWGCKRTWRFNEKNIYFQLICFNIVKVICADLPVRMEDIVWSMKKETGAVTAGLISLGNVVKSTTVQITA